MTGLVNQLQKETVTMMEFILSNSFVLSGNLHGGAVVVSYPYDSVPLQGSDGVPHLTPDDAIFKKLAHEYASYNHVMSQGESQNSTLAI